MRIRIGAEAVTAALAFCLAAFILQQGRELGIGTTTDPGSGFILFWTGLIMGGLSITLLVHAFLGGGEFVSLAAPFRGTRWAKVVYVLALLLAYTYLLDILGFLLGTFLLLLILFKTVEPQRWWVALIGSAISTASAWAVFVYWLGTQMPRGLIGIG